MAFDNGYVLKNSDGLYYCGYCGLDTFKKELCKAQIYHSKKHAEEALNKLAQEKQPLFYKEVTRDFKVIKITISEDVD